jgi:hypothetical protein
MEAGAHIQRMAMFIFTLHLTEQFLLYFTTTKRELYFLTTKKHSTCYVFKLLDKGFIKKPIALMFSPLIWEAKC